MLNWSQATGQSLQPAAQVPRDPALSSSCRAACSCWPRAPPAACVSGRPAGSRARWVVQCELVTVSGPRSLQQRPSPRMRLQQPQAMDRGREPVSGVPVQPTARYTAVTGL